MAELQFALGKVLMSAQQGRDDRRTLGDEELSVNCYSRDPDERNSLAICKCSGDNLAGEEEKEEEAISVIAHKVNIPLSLLNSTKPNWLIEAYIYILYI